MKKILYKQEDGTIAILNPSPDIRIEEAITHVPVGLPYLVVDAKSLPSDENINLFFSALAADFDTPSDPKVRINIAKAKEITKERLRIERKRLFDANDILLRDAMLENNKAKIDKAIAERDRLRDVTKKVDDANTIEAFKKLRP